MKKGLGILVIIGIIAVMLTSCKTKKYAAKYREVPVDEEITVKLGDTLKIELVSNITTGYTWEDVYYSNRKIVKFVEKKYTGPTNPKMMGASGKDIFTFVAGKEGQTNLTFEYKKAETVDKYKNYKITCTK